MCGIVGAIAQRNVQAILVEGLKRLEYRGYDSAGVAILDQGVMQRARALGKVAELENKLEQQPFDGHLGIAHTRWATHGKPEERNAHPHRSAGIAVVHNGIIENHKELRAALKADGYEFSSDTDTEVIVHLLHKALLSEASLLAALKKVVPQLEGAYGLAAICEDEPESMVVARSGSPLVVGIGVEENFIASDVAALLPVTSQFIYLQEGDIASITATAVEVIDAAGNKVERDVKQSALSADAAERGEYRHFMLKEIYEQPVAIRNTLVNRLGDQDIDLSMFGDKGADFLANIDAVHIVSCGTSYHAGLVARYWIEQLAGIPCVVEIASEYRYRQPVVTGKPLFLSISQSGETADTMAALQLSKQLGYAASLSICNVADSSLTRESDMAVLTHAGPEIGVASTKAFTTQLAVLLMFAGALRQIRNNGPTDGLVKELRSVAAIIEQTLDLDAEIKTLAETFVDKDHALFLGRGSQYPIAMEGALKLKEISYIHAESYAAGELKHGPLALVDENMPIVAVAPNNELLDKLKSNLEEVRARGGQLIVFADTAAGFENEDNVTVIPVPECGPCVEPIVYTLPLQLLSYHVAVLKGTDVDQPRNLAKSVTVE